MNCECNKVIKFYVVIVRVATGFLNCGYEECELSKIRDIWGLRGPVVPCETVGE